MIVDIALNLEVGEDRGYIYLSPDLRAFGSSFTGAYEIYLFAGQLEDASLREALDGRDEAWGGARSDGSESASRYNISDSPQCARESGQTNGGSPDQGKVGVRMRALGLLISALKRMAASEQ